MEAQKIITYVNPKPLDKNAGLILDKILKDFPVVIRKISTVQELFPLLSDPLYHSDYVVININGFYKSNKTDIFDVIHALSTLLKCTVSRVDSKKPHKRKTSIVAAIEESTDISLIREISLVNEISYITADFFESIPYDQLHDEIDNLLIGGERLSKFVKKKKTKTKKDNPVSENNPVLLTPRQSQILNIITSRGASNKAIAKILNISESTVKLHLGSMFKKYGVKTRTQLALFAKHDD